ncbi:MAG: 4-(cytidine 5'-diphospho)-2-C-methyl-D-erythritol kinase, partial [Actinomycetota bacterium]|nr:4-(cytidine 5'-diphospho)-2-C-methyl-D-erythritol kinase [Actinomycetota bacterium]
MTVTYLSAPAKLTLSLNVVGVRHDGYHLVDAEMVAVNLTDGLEVSDGDGLEVMAVDGGLEVLEDGENLVAR